MKIKVNKYYTDITAEREKLAQKCKLFFYNYLKNTGYDDNLINEIVSDSFINNNPLYYTYYPYLYCDFFCVYDDDILKKLSLAGFLYYRYILLVDKTLDTTEKLKFNDFLLSDICSEEAIKILSQLFPLDSDFWLLWKKRKKEYIDAYYQDKVLRKDLSFDEFSEHSNKKSSFGKIAIDSLYLLSNKENKDIDYNYLLNLHKVFYTSFQVLDDIKDFQDDINNNQYNICYDIIKSKYGLLVDTNNLKSLKELLYRNEVNDLYFESYNSLIELDVKSNRLLSFEIDSLTNTIVTNYLNVNAYTYFIDKKSSLSYSIRKNNTIDKATEMAINFLSNNQQNNGSFIDYFNDAGISNVWVSAYCFSFLNNISNDLDICKKLNNYLNSISNSEFSYNINWIPDGDSTNFIILHRIANNDISDSDINKLLSYQKEDGGFCTYNDIDALRSSLNSDDVKEVYGWNQSHFCVSSVSLFCLKKLKLTKQFDNARNFILKFLNKGLLCNSYWWTSDIYAYYYLQKVAIIDNDPTLTNIIDKKISFIIDNHDIPSDLLFVAYLVMIIKSSDLLKQKYSEHYTFLLNFLIENQFQDGSFGCSKNLRIPGPNRNILELDSIIWKNENKGTDVIIEDFSRVFTTITCLAALHEES